MDQSVIDYCKKVGVYLSPIRTSSLQGLSKQGVSNIGANYRLVYEDNSQSKRLNHYNSSGICHSGLNLSSYDYNPSNPIRANAKALLTYVMPFKGDHNHDWPTEESLHAYYYWMANHSPVAYAFITKDPEEMINEGLIIDPRVPISHFIFACILSRVPTEFHIRPFSIKIITEGMKAGVSPLLLLGIGYSMNNSAVYLANSCGGHSPINLFRQGLTNIRAVIKGKMNPTSPKLYTEVVPWGGVFRLFNRTREEVKFSKDFENKLNSLINPETVTIPKVNHRFGSSQSVLNNGLSDEKCKLLINFLFFFQEDIMKITKEQTWLQWGVRATNTAEAA